jgi:hypothetical protein
MATGETIASTDSLDDASPNEGNIRIEYHPSSGREPKTLAFGDFIGAAAATDSTLPVDPDPWVPFRTRHDFEFAELVLDAGMSKDQVNAMIGLIHRCTNGKGSFTLKSYDEMHKTLAVASERLPKVCL